MKFFVAITSFFFAAIFIPSTNAVLAETPTSVKPDQLLKPGLWEIVRTETAMGKERSTKEERCAGSRAKELALLVEETSKTAKKCTFSMKSATGRRVEYVRRCVRDEGVIETFTTVAEGNFSSKFTRTVSASFSIPTPLEGMVEKKVHTFKGNCGKQLRPGDSIIFDESGRAISMWNRYSSPDAKLVSAQAPK